MTNGDGPLLSTLKSIAILLRTPKVWKLYISERENGRARRRRK